MSSQKILTLFVMITVTAFQTPFFLIGGFGGLALLAIIMGFGGAQNFWENARRDLNDDERRK